MAISVTNAGPDTETLHVLPTAWFRSTWSWGGSDSGRLKMAADGSAAVRIVHPFGGNIELTAGNGPDGAEPAVLFCENETNGARLFGTVPLTPYPKDGINDHVTGGAGTVNQDLTGTKCAFWYQVTLAPGASAELRLRLRPAGQGSAADAGPAGTVPADTV